jgi:hypothetical protein
MAKRDEMISPEALLQQIERIGERVATLEAKIFSKPTEPAPQPWSERPVMITVAHTPPADLPTLEEAKLLLEKVREKFPTFRRQADADEAKYLQQFRNAFRFIVQAYRRSEINESVSGDWWCGEAREFLHNVRADSDISWGPIVAATIAAGDIKFSDPAGWPHIYLALNRGSREHPYKPIFREILRGTRAFLTPVARAKPPSSAGASVHYGETSVIHAMRAKGMLDY